MNRIELNIERVERRESMKTPLLVCLVVLMHILAVGSFVFIQGCGTMTPVVVEPAPEPVMPPNHATVKPVRPAEPILRKPAVIDAQRVVEPVDFIKYTVKPGDSLSKIAVAYGVSAREVAEINNLKNMNSIYVNQTLVMPAHARPSATSRGVSSSPSPHSSKPIKTVKPGEIYVVKAGDYLGKIAAAHGTTVAAIKQLNKLSGDVINIGQKLRLPDSAKSVDTARPVSLPPAAAPAVPKVTAAPQKPETPAVPETAQETTPELPEEMSVPSYGLGAEPFPYTWVEGDTLEKVARTFAVSTNDILSVNNMTDVSRVEAGQKIFIPQTD